MPFSQTFRGCLFSLLLRTQLKCHFLQEALSDHCHTSRLVFFFFTTLLSSWNYLCTCLCPTGMQTPWGRGLWFVSYFLIPQQQCLAHGRSSIHVCWLTAKMKEQAYQWRVGSVGAGSPSEHCQIICGLFRVKKILQRNPPQQSHQRVGRGQKGSPI